MTQVASNNIPGLVKVTHISPVDFSVAYTSSSTITVTGAPFTVDDSNCFVAYIMYRPSGGTWQPPIINGRESITASSNVITVVGVSPFVSGDEYIVGISYQDKGYSSAEDSNQVSVGNQLNTEYVGETLADVTNEADSSEDYYIDMSGYKGLTVQFEKVGGSDTNALTLHGSCQDDGTAAASCNYIDVTQYGFDIISWSTASGSYDVDTMLKLSEGSNFKYIKANIATSGGGNDGDYKIFVKKWY